MSTGPSFLEKINPRKGCNMLSVTKGKEIAPETRYKTDFVNQPVQQREEAIVEQWKEKDIFRQGIRRAGGKPFVTYDGPPFATGNPHYGHVLAMTIKDAICSHKALDGHDVTTKFGWDCHGVPIETLVQKKLNLLTHAAITDLGIDKFNTECRKLIFTCVEEWDKQTKRLGRFIDMGQGRDYKTMDSSYMSSVWSVFGRLYDKGLIYKGHKVVAYSPALGTVLSDFEAGQNYKKIISPAITMAFPLQADPNTHVLVWTTTPWSVPANVAIAVNANHQYVKVSLPTGMNYIVLKNLSSQYFTDPAVVVSDIDIKDYIGQSYVPMFDCLPKSIDSEAKARCYHIVESSHVTDSDGTGCVHICPAYGVDDHAVGQRYGLPIVDFIDQNGHFNDVVRSTDDSSLGVKGLYFKKVYGDTTAAVDDDSIADVVLLKQMKASGRLFKNATVHHEYPLCWRTNTPLMYRAVESWFVNVAAIKSSLISNNTEVKWHPENVGTNRFANWLGSARDWAISRTRYWGCPMPIWTNVEDPSDHLIIKSQHELESLTGQKLSDLHREYIDQLDIVVGDKKYRRISEVFDCWFESGSMPYAQQGLQFNGDETAFLEHQFPADFIAEGLDQTRGWFYALSVIGTALFGTMPFKHVVVNGILLGSDGKKMSKSVGNFPPIDTTFNQYGADAIRLFLLASPAVQADSISVKDESIKVCFQHVIIPILNVYKFFADAANRVDLHLGEPIDCARLISGEQFGPLNPFDAWLIYRTEAFKKSMVTHFDAYDLAKATLQINDYVSDLTHWYVRMSRSRANRDNPTVFYLLQYALDSFSRYAAAIAPFISESIFQGLYGNESSVHLGLYSPIYDTSSLRHDYETVEKVRQIYSMSLSIREKHNLRLRQPLQTIYLNASFADTLRPYESIIKDLINCEEISWIVPGDNDLFATSIKLASDLGKKLKRDFQPVKNAFQKGEYRLEDNGATLILSTGHALRAADGDFSHVIESKSKDFECDLKGDLWLVLDIRMTELLVQKGLARDLLREIITIRKEMGCNVGDNFEIVIDEAFRSLVSLIDATLTEKKCFVQYASIAEDSQSREISLGERGAQKIRIGFKGRETAHMVLPEQSDGSLRRDAAAGGITFFAGSPAQSMEALTSSSSENRLT